jgi:HlyD family secretion protein
VAAVVAGAAVAWGWRIGPSPASPTAYETQPASLGVIRKVVATSGPVRALVTVSVGSQLSGQIERVDVDFNSTVKPGDLMARIDAKTYAARVTQAKADLAAAEAALANQQAALIKAQSILTLAERTTERQRTLAAKGFASTSALDTSTRDAEVARADIAVAKAQIESAKATIEQRKAQLKQAEIDLERTEIRAPIEGTVISRTVDPGQTVAASLQSPELFKIAQDLSRIRIEAQVNEADVGSVAEGNPAQFTVDAYPERRFEGRVTQVRLAATEINNVVTYTVIVEAANEDRRLFPGMTANVEIEAARKEQALRVPNDALRVTLADNAAGASQGEPSSSRSERTVERLKTEIGLDEAQEKAVREGLGRMFKEMRDAQQGRMGSGPSDPAVIRQRMHAAIEQSLGPMLSEEQRRLFDKWKRGVEGSRFGSVWVLKPGGVPVRQRISLGISDDQFTEVAGAEVKEGDPIVVRARRSGP